MIILLQHTNYHIIKMEEKKKLKRMEREKKAHFVITNKRHRKAVATITMEKQPLDILRARQIFIGEITHNNASSRVRHSFFFRLSILFACIFRYLNRQIRKRNYKLKSNNNNKRCLWQKKAHFCQLIGISYSIRQPLVQRFVGEKSTTSSFIK